MNTFIRITPEILVTVITSVSAISISLIAFLSGRRVRQKNRELEQLVASLRHEINGLYNSSATLADRSKKIEAKLRSVAEAQEQFTLKDTSYQSYQNALRLIKSGQSHDKIAETSGLSRGEIEMLSVLQRVEAEHDEPL